MCGFQRLVDASDEEAGNDDNESSAAGCTLFVKNLNFTTTEDALKQVSNIVSRVSYMYCELYVT